MCKNCFLQPIFMNVFPFSHIHNEFPHLDFPITETWRQIVKTETPKSKVESWFKPRRKVFVKRLFWFVHNRGKDLVLCLPENPRGELFIFRSNLHYSAFLGSQGWIHYADTVHKLKSILWFSEALPFNLSSARPRVLRAFLTWHFPIGENDFEGTKTLEGRELLWTSISALLHFMIYPFVLFFSLLLPFHSTSCVPTCRWQVCFHSAAVELFWLDAEREPFVLFFSVIWNCWH